jgi:hypothetical protein
LILQRVFWANVSKRQQAAMSLFTYENEHQQVPANISKVAVFN